MTATQPAISSDKRAALRRAFDAELDAAREARDRGDIAAEWSHLERAHILSQPMARPHLLTLQRMFGAAWRRRDGREIVGQLLRLLLAVPGTLSGRYPVGNTGGADVSAFKPMPIPDDLAALLEEDPR
jgi:hypothetical protein